MLATCVVLAGLFLGINNTLITETVMKAATRTHLIGIDVEEDELEELTEQATAVTVGSYS